MQISLQKAGKKHSLRLCGITVRGSWIIKPNKSTHALNEDSHCSRSKEQNEMRKDRGSFLKGVEEASTTKGQDTLAALAGHALT